MSNNTPSSSNGQHSLTDWGNNSQSSSSEEETTTPGITASRAEKEDRQSNDGHKERAISPRWHDEADQRDPTFSNPLADSLLPVGRIAIVLQAGDDVEKGYGQDGDLSPGVYLRGRDSYTDRPPTPVTVNDTQLQFGAEWCLHTAREIASDPSDVVCISKEHGRSLNIGLSRQSKAQISHVGSIGAGTSTGDEEKHDFHLIRTFDTPKELYIRTDEPRLDISDLRPDSLEGFSISR